MCSERCPEAAVDSIVLLQLRLGWCVALVARVPNLSPEECSENLVSIFCLSLLPSLSQSPASTQP